MVQIQGTAVSIEAKPLLLLNPSTVRQGSSVGVTGSGFDPGATVDIYVKQQASDSVDPLTFIQVDKSGGFGGVTFAVPDALPRGNFLVEADQRESANVARATAVIAGGSPQVKLGTQAAKSGDTVQLSATGFGPDEDINVYWNDLSSDVIGAIQTDDSGGVRQGSVRVPFGAVDDALVDAQRELDHTYHPSTMIRISAGARRRPIWRGGGLDCTDRTCDGRDRRYALRDRRGGDRDGSAHREPAGAWHRVPIWR